MNRRRGMRISLGGLIVLVAIFALGINAIRPRTTKFVDLKVGAGPPVKLGDNVEIHYVGRLYVGSFSFPSSKPRGKPPAYKIGGGKGTPGWEGGLIGMRAGGVRELTVPPEQAYGKRGLPGSIPPDATLRFTVELLKIK